MGNLSKSRTMMKLTIALVLIATVFAQAPVKPHPNCARAVSKNGRCGTKFGNTRCAGGYCSKWNWCGSSALHKKTHQAKFDAVKCPSKKPVAPKKNVGCSLKVSKNGRCGRKFGNTRCAQAGSFCSRWNWCGKSKLHKKTQQRRFNYRRCGAKLRVKVRVVKKAKKTAKKAPKKAKKVVKKAKKAKKAKKVLKVKVVKKAKKVVKKAEKAKKAKKAKKVVKKAKKAVKKAKKAKKAKKVVKKAKKVVKKAKKAKKAKKVVKKVVKKAKKA